MCEAYLRSLEHFLCLAGYEIEIAAKQERMGPYIGILMFLAMFGVCSDPCACSGVTKVVPDTIGACSAFKVEI